MSVTTKVKKLPALVMTVIFSYLQTSRLIHRISKVSKNIRSILQTKDQQMLESRGTLVIDIMKLMEIHQNGLLDPQIFNSGLQYMVGITNGVELTNFYKYEYRFSSLNLYPEFEPIFICERAAFLANKKFR